MKSIINDYCVRMFTGSDSLRPALMNVNIQDGYLYATNAHIVGKIKSDLCIKEYNPVEKFPNCEAVLSGHKSIEKKVVSVDDLFNDLMKIEVCFKPKMEECGECDGTGTAICDHCGSEYYCKKCGGRGDTPTTELELSGESNCTLFNKKYRLHYLDLIIRTAVYTGVKEIEISNAEGLSGTMFYVGDFKILLMPTTN